MTPTPTLTAPSENNHPAHRTGATFIILSTRAGNRDCGRGIPKSCDCPPLAWSGDPKTLRLPSARSSLRDSQFLGPPPLTRSGPRSFWVPDHRCPPVLVRENDKGCPSRVVRGGQPALDRRPAAGQGQPNAGKEPIMTALERIAEQRALQSLYDLCDACRLAQNQWQQALDAPTSLETRRDRADVARRLLTEYMNEVESYLRNNR